MRVYAVGDIHGRADLLEDLHRRIINDASEAEKAENLVVYLGDYIDRGAEVRKVLDILIAGLDQNFQAVHLRGNHEEIMLHFLEDVSGLEAWLTLGGQATLLSYKVAAPAPGTGFFQERAFEVQNALLQALPQEHLRFLGSLPTSFTLGDYFFAHAGIRPGLELCRQTTDDLLWIREEFLFADTQHQAKVVHGHSVAPQPEFLPNRIGLDTGAYATGVLSCVVLEEERVRLLG